MLDGAASESMPVPVGFRPNLGPPPINESPPVRPTIERNGVPPNFTDIPPHLLKSEDPRGGGDQPSPDEVAVMQQIMEQVAQQKKPAEERLDKSQIPLVQKKAEDKVPVEEKKETSGFKEKINAVWEKVKSVAKKIWYYGSGSFIWDRFSS